MAKQVGIEVVDTTVPKYLLVEDHIKQGIKDKTITDRLPGERILAKELGFSYMTIRKAIDNLVDEGLLYRIPTKGTFVVDRRTSRRNETLSIGYFLDSSIEGGISSPYYSLIFNALEKEATRNGYSLTYFSDGREDNLNKVLKKLDGVIATCFPRIEDTIEDINEAVPVVVMDNSASDKSIPSVIIDNYSAEAEAVDYLCSLGHRRIGFICGLADSDIGKNRFAGFRKGLKNNDLIFDESLVFRGDYSYEAGLSGADYFLGQEKKPTAIICANDSMALGAMGQFHKHGLKVPDDISVVGFDDITVASRVIPPLTTTAVPVVDMARHAFHALINLIRRQEVDSQHIALPTQLMIRDTCAAASKSSVVAA